MQELNLAQLEQVSGGLSWWQIVLIGLVSPSAALTATGASTVSGVRKDNQTKADIHVVA